MIVLRTISEALDFLESFDGYGLSTIDHGELTSKLVLDYDIVEAEIDGDVSLIEIPLSDRTAGYLLGYNHGKSDRTREILNEITAISKEQSSKGFYGTSERTQNVGIVLERKFLQSPATIVDKAVSNQSTE